MPSGVEQAGSAARWEPVARRAVDLVVVVIALMVLVIPMLLIALMIRVGTPGQAFYRQQRIGPGGRLFTMYKFRTMRVGCSDSQHRDLIARELRGEDTSVGGMRSWSFWTDLMILLRTVPTVLRGHGAR
ncbi:MAG: sugar transferase [Actinobacteria bacterium]|nr:sugar transferase [Actinomycetota bacterium]